MSNIRAISRAPAFKRWTVSVPDFVAVGRVIGTKGGLVEVELPLAALGDMFSIETRYGSLLGEVVALGDGRAQLMPFGRSDGVVLGGSVRAHSGSASIPAGAEVLGRALDAFGMPLDAKGPLLSPKRESLRMPPRKIEEAATIDEQMHFGVRALDAFMPCGVGQRLGIFAPAGVGKTTLLSMIAEHAVADVVVIALIGERTREVAEFCEAIFSNPRGESTVLVCATSDRSPGEKVRAARVATALACSFEREGKRVLFLMDSLTRLCMSKRQVGLAAGEPPTTRGYPPSAFEIIPEIVERAGNYVDGGSITGIYTVLLEDDSADLSDPVGEAAKGYLDGHIYLSRKLAERGVYPAVAILRSLSRTSSVLLSVEQHDTLRFFRSALAMAEESEDLVLLGAYERGANPELDRALEVQDALRSFLTQRSNDPLKNDEQSLWPQLRQLADRWRRG